MQLFTNPINKYFNYNRTHITNVDEIFHDSVMEITAWAQEHFEKLCICQHRFHFFITEE